MAFWEIDLTTRAGARGALHQASLGAFAFSAMAALGVAVGIWRGAATPDGIAFMVGGGLELVVSLVAGFRLRGGKGLYWTIAAVALLAIELITKIVTLTIGGGTILMVIALVVLVNGIRAGLSLKRGTGFEDDDAEVFS